MCEVMVLSSSTTLAASMSCWRFFTWPGCLVSAWTIQNSVSDSSTTWPFHSTDMRSLSSVSAPRRMTCFSSGGPAQRVDAAEQRIHARDQVRQRQVLGEEIVGAEPQARHRVELAVARGEENDRQLGRQAAQLAAQLEAAFGFVLERDVDDGEVRQARGEGRHGLAAIRIAAHRVAFAREGRGVVVADGAFVFDDGDGLFHGSEV